MGFKKTSEGRVFFEKLDDSANDEITKTTGGQSFRPSSLAPSGSMGEQQTQVQIVALLKTLNERLKVTQAERNQMRKELDAYRDLIEELEGRSERSEKAYLELQQKLAKDGQENSQQAEKLAQEALKEMQETRKLLLELEGKTENADRALEALKGDVTRHQNVGSQLIQKQKALEELQKQHSDKFSEHGQIAAKIVQRIKDGEERYETLSDKLDSTSTEQARIGRKLEKALEERARFMRKIERIEETVLQTRDSLNAKAMVLLTDQNVAAQGDGDEAALQEAASAALLNADKSAQTVDQFAPAPEALKPRAESNNALTPQPQWWEQIRIQYAAAIGGALLVGGVISVLLYGLINDDKPLFSVSPSSDSENAAWNVDERSDHRAAEFSLDEIMPPSQRITENPTPLPENTDETPTASSTGDNTDDDSGLAQGSPAKIEADYNDDIGTMELNNGDQVRAALEGRDLDAVAPSMNAIEPGSVAQGAQDNAAANAVSVSTPRPTNGVVSNDINSAALNLGRLAQNPVTSIRADSSLPDVIKNIETQAFDGLAEAQHDLAAVYTAGHGGVSQNFERARFWFEQAAARGIPNAAYNIGVIYHQGLGVKANIEKALQWYDVAAQDNHPEAQYNLGIAYIEGIGVPYNPQKATQYFINAAEADIMEAAYNLGLIYENGLLGSAKPDEALMWYKIAADQGSQEAGQALEQLAKTLDIDTREVNRLADGMKELRKPETVEAINERVQNTVPNPTVSQQIMVSQAQDYLIELGLYPGPADGITGPLTADAVRSYQRMNQLSVNGVVSQALIDHMASKIDQGSRAE